MSDFTSPEAPESAHESTIVDAAPQEAPAEPEMIVMQDGEFVPEDARPDWARPAAANNGVFHTEDKTGLLDNPEE